MINTKFIMVAVAAGALASQAFAKTSLSNEVIKQDNPMPSFSQLNFIGNWLGELRGQSLAIGNNISISSDADTLNANLLQVQMGDVASMLYVKAHDVAGDVALTSTAVCNNAAVSGGAMATGVTNWQRCMTLDPAATADVIVGGVGGDVSVAATSISNNLEVNATGYWGQTLSWQNNGAANYAVANVTANDVAGAVNVSATAIGNNVSIRQSFGGTP